jgi:hypothetical protein
MIVDANLTTSQQPYENLAVFKIGVGRVLMFLLAVTGYMESNHKSSDKFADGG